jgi:CheY-like chemotaxis protein
MGGDLRVTSTPGQGSIFWFDLPLSKVDETASAKEEHRRIIGVQNRRPKILVVDDNVDNRAIIIKQLSPLGFDMAEASNAAEGIDQAAVFKPQAIIVDLRLPDYTGVELIQDLRRHTLLKDTVIIVSSASVFAEDRHQSLAAGADNFLPKPIRTEHLLDMLEQHLSLEWCYTNEHIQDDTPRLSPSFMSLPAGNLPAVEEIARLYELATMGHAAALQEQAAKLAQLDAPCAAVAAEVERLARRLQINEACALLEQYLER